VLPPLRLEQDGVYSSFSKKGVEQRPPMTNLLDNVPTDANAEIITDLLIRPGIRIERIVSTGQSTPHDAPYDQPHDEWVLLLAGAAGLWIEGEGERTLRPGDCLLIQAHRRHRVTWTPAHEPSVWLAIHFDTNLCRAD
jgi:cupin 2 domain-containing protein